jgi:hypothetical protein
LVQFQATTADFLATGSAINGTLLDFNIDVTNIAIRAIGTAGPNAVGTLFIDNVTNAANTILTLDVDGNGLFSAGDIQVVLTGQAYTGATGSIVGGNFLL